MQLPTVDETRTEMDKRAQSHYSTELLQDNNCWLSVNPWRKEGREGRQVHAELYIGRCWRLLFQGTEWYSNFNKLLTKDIEPHQSPKHQKACEVHFQTMSKEISGSHQAFKPQKQETRTSPGFMHNSVLSGTPNSNYCRIYKQIPVLEAQIFKKHSCKS